MKQSWSFFTSIVLLMCVAFTAGELFAGPDQYKHVPRDGYAQERYVSEEERLLDKMKAREKQYQYLAERRKEAEQRKIKASKFKAYLSEEFSYKKDSKQGFLDWFKASYPTLQRRGGPSEHLEFGQSVRNTFVLLLRDCSDQKICELKQSNQQKIAALTARIAELTQVLAGDGEEPGKKRAELELSLKQAELAVVEQIKEILDTAKNEQDIRELTGIHTEEGLPDPDLAALKDLVEACKDDEAYKALRGQKEKQYNKEFSKAEDELKEMHNYDNVTNMLFRTFLSNEYDGISATGTTAKITLALTLPFVKSVRKSLDAQYERVTNRFVRYLSDSLHDVAVSFGLASPLSVKKVTAWGRMVGSFKKSMDTYAKGSADSTDVSAAFGARANLRLEKPGYGADVPAQTADMAAQVNGTEEAADDVTDYIRHADPVYVKTTTDFVRQMRRQITVIVRRMKGDSYAEQREILSEILKTLDCIGYLAVGSFKVYRQLNFTQVLNRDISLCCESISNQLVGLKDLINSADDVDDSSSSTTSPYGGKNSRMGLD